MGRKVSPSALFVGPGVPNQEQPRPELLGLEVYPTLSKEAHAQTDAFSRVFPSQNFTEAGQGCREGQEASQIPYL